MGGIAMEIGDFVLESPTEKQLELIDSIEEFTPHHFTGATKQEASAFITLHIDEFRLESMDSWALEKGYF
jgi:hypothetical protein